MICTNFAEFVLFLRITYWRARGSHFITQRVFEILLVLVLPIFWRKISSAVSTVLLSNAPKNLV